MTARTLGTRVVGTVLMLALGGCWTPDGEDAEARGVLRQGAGTGPDFVITSVTGPTSLMPGQPFTANVTVCNQGTVPDGTEVELYFSSDAIITPGSATSPSPDQPLKRVPTNYLNPGQCQTLPISANAYVPSEGAWYLGAVADPTNTRVELLEDNNILAGTRMGIGTKGDFIITSVTGPATATPGQPFTATVTVCNQGTVGDGTDVELYFSSDAVITPTTMPSPTTDQPLKRTPTNYLNPGQCQTLVLPVNAYVPTEGAWYLGAAADPSNSRVELIEDNNTLAGTRMGIGTKGDFVITAVTGPASVQPNQPFTATVTVCNQGTVGDGTDVELYFSSDAVITPTTMPSPTTDLPVRRVPTNYLSPGQCQTLTVSAYASVPSEGAWYLGAAADPSNTRVELLEDNNTRAGTKMGVGNKADFIITSVTGPASVLPNQSFTATMTVCNQGTVSDSTDVELYLSSDAIITPTTTPSPTTDLPVRRVPTNYLSPGQCQTLTVSAYASVPSEGAWYLGAVADSSNTRVELIEDNNTLAGTRMGVGNKADFVITSVTGPASVLPNQPFTATVTVCNQGTVPDGTDVDLYLSADAVITPTTTPGPTSDQPVRRVPTSYLSPKQCQTLSFSANAYVPSEGAWYLGAVADPSNTRVELIEDNNTLAGTRMGVGNKADFIITSVMGPASVLPNQPFTAEVKVCNQGMGSDSTEVELYLSSDAIITPTTMPSPTTDQPLKRTPTNYLAPGQCQTLSIPANAYAPSEGAWYLGAAADPSNTRVELIEDNNALAGTRMGVGNKADFVITSVTGPATAMPGQPFTANVTVCNQGTMSDGTEVELYFSSDDVITLTTMPSPTSDQPVKRVPTNYLTPGQCQTLSIPANAYVPSEGAWYLGAIVDPSNTRVELIEDNNSRAGTKMGIGNKADFIITSVTGPTSVAPGQAFTANVTVCNQGTMSDGTEVELYLSSDDVITPTTMPSPTTDQPLKRVPTNYLSPGQCQTLTVSANAYVPSSGSWYLGAAADPGNTRVELLEDNNTLAGTLMYVGP